MEANTKGGQPGSVSSPAGSIHLSASVLKVAIPAGDSVVITGNIHYLATVQVYKLFTYSSNILNGLDGSVNDPDTKHIVPWW